MMMKGKRKTKSDKVWSSLLFAFSLLLIAPASDAGVEPLGENWYVLAPAGSYVDTGFKPGSGVRVKMDVIVGDSSKREYWFGCWDTDYNKGAFAMGNDGKNVYIGYANQDGSLHDQVVPSGHHTVEFSNTWAKVDGAVVSTLTETDFHLNHNLYLFAQNRRGTAAAGDGQERIVCGGCQIWTNDASGASVLVRDFVPATLLDAQTSGGEPEVGFLDQVTGRFFGNAGAPGCSFGLARKSLVTLDAQGGGGGTPSVEVFTGDPMPSVTVPKRDGFSFDGYYDDPVAGMRYYMEDGSSARAWDRVADVTLFAHWWAPGESQLPAGYTAVNWIGSTSGGNQYIDTEYTHKADTRIVCEVEVSDVQPGTWAAIFGARKNNWQSNAFCFFACSNNGVCYNRTDEEKRNGDAFPRNQKVELTCVGDTAKWTVVGSTDTNSLTTSGTCDGGVNTMFLFNLNTAGDGGKKADTSPCVMKLYSFKIFEGETLVREYAPCFNDLCEPGLYEAQNRTFHKSMADEEFAFPPGRRVTVNLPPFTKGVWTSGDGSKTNEIVGSSFRIASGTAEVAVILNAVAPYYFSDGTTTKTIRLGTILADVEPSDERYDDCGTQIDAVKYVDENGCEQSCCEYVLVTPETSVMTGGWYLVEGSVSRAGIDVAGGQTVNLILADGAVLTTANGGSSAGIDVSPGETLNIYAQSGGTGRLVATGSGGSAGIGGSNGGSCGTVVICGGEVSAYGAPNSSGAGIGGGTRGAGGTVVIKGGVVTAHGNSYGPAIGAGRNSSGGTAIITGGAVNLSSERSDAFRCDSISISGGVFANYVDSAWCADGYGLFENDDPATKNAYRYSVEPMCTVSIADRSESAAVLWTSGDGSVTNVLEGESFYVRLGTENVKVFFVVYPAYDYISGDLFYDLQTVSKDVTITCNVEGVHHTVEYVDAVGRVFTNDTFVVVTETTSVMTGGWYLVEGEVECGGLDVAEGQTVSLILADGASLRASGGVNAAGIDVRSDEVLRIYCQRGGTGRLTATGGTRGAGIGGGDECPAAGTVVINGGVITASGGWSAAGIGGGGGNVYAGSGPSRTGAGGTCVISNGAVKVTAANGGGQVIGHGNDNLTQGVIEISGGIFAMSIEDEWVVDGFSTYPNPDPETSSEYPYAVMSVYTITIEDAPVGVDAFWTSGDGSVTNAVKDGKFVVLPETENVKVLFMPDPAYIYVSGETVFELRTVSENMSVHCPVEVVHRKVEYIDADRRLRTNDTFVVVTPETSVMTGGWYLVEGSVSRAGIDVAGGETVNLILADGASLTANGDIYDAGVEVDSGATLNIYAQTGDTGCLTGSGGKEGAGIGGRSVCAGGTIRVFGGVVTGVGGWRSAGIGGGYTAGGGTVVISGGIVTAHGGMNASGIGAGVYGSGGTAIITGGAVSLSGDKAGVFGCDSISISGGIFAMNVEEAWLAPECVVRANLDPATKGAYPHAVSKPCVFKLPVLDAHLSCVVSNETLGVELEAVSENGTNTYEVLSGYAVKAYCTPDEGYRFAGSEFTADLGVVEADTVFEVADLPLALGLLTVEAFPAAKIYDGEPTNVTWAVTAYGQPSDAATVYLREEGIEDWTLASEFVPYRTVTNVTVEVRATQTGCEEHTNSATVVISRATVLPEDAEEPGAGSVPEGGVSKFDVTAMYDGTGHGFDVAAISNAYAAILIGPFTVACDALFANAGVYATSYTITSPNYETYERAAQVTVTSRPATVTSVSATFIYDGREHSEETITQVGFVDGEGVTGENFAKIVNLGSVSNAFSYVFQEGTLSENYSVTCITGELVVVKSGWQLAFESEGATVESELGEDGVSGFSVVLGKNYENGLTLPDDLGAVTIDLNGWEISGTNGVNGTSSLPGTDGGPAIVVSGVSGVNAGSTQITVMNSAHGAQTGRPERSGVFGGKGGNGNPPGKGSAAIVDASGAKVEVADGAELLSDGEDGVNLIPGGQANPWRVGDDVVAYTNGESMLTIEGTGAMYDFANAEDVPWDSDAVTAVTVGEGVTKIGANSLSAFDDAVLFNGASLSLIRFATPGLGSTVPSGAISPAEFTRIDIVDGKALLGVSVYTSESLTNEVWSCATNGVIEVPASAPSGYYILKSKGAK